MQFTSCRFGKMTTLSLTNCHLANPHSVAISEWQEGNRSFWSTAGMPHHTAVIETLPPDDDEELTFGVFEQNTKPKTTHRNKCE